jgi:hypothetical protein
MITTKLQRTEIYVESPIKFSEDMYFEDAISVMIKYFKDELSSTREHFILITLKRRTVEGIHLISIGNSTRSSICNRAIIKHIIEDGADEVMFVHNHPLQNVVDYSVTSLDESIASDEDLFTYFSLTTLMTGIGVIASFMIITSDLLYASVYFPSDRLNDCTKPLAWKIKQKTFSTKRGKKVDTITLPVLIRNIPKEFLFEKISFGLSKK